MYVVLFSILFRDFFFFFNDTATTEIYTLSLHDALPISGARPDGRGGVREGPHLARAGARDPARPDGTRVSQRPDRKSTRLNSSHQIISYAVFCLKKKKAKINLLSLSDHLIHRKIILNKH